MRALGLPNVRSTLSSTTSRERRNEPGSLHLPPTRPTSPTDHPSSYHRRRCRRRRRHHRDTLRYTVLVSTLPTYVQVTALHQIHSSLRTRPLGSILLSPPRSVLVHFSPLRSRPYASIPRVKDALSRLRPRADHNHQYSRGS